MVRRLVAGIFGLALMAVTLLIAVLFAQGLYQQYWAWPHLATQIRSHYAMPLSISDIAARLMACFVLALFAYTSIRLLGFALRGIDLSKSD